MVSVTVEEIPRLLTRREAAAAARMSYGFFSRLIARNEGPRETRFGGKFLIRENELTAWIDARTAAPVETAA